MKTNLFPKPIIVVSKCIEFEHTRYNGDIISSDTVKKLKSFADFIPVCPEVEIGLGIPRSPIRLVIKENEKALYQPESEKFFTNEMIQFSEQFLKTLPDIDGVILKNQSPSCGTNNVKIYHSAIKDSGSKPGTGLFAEKVKECFPDHAIEDEGRLKNFSIREHFFIRLFVKARFREIKNNQKIQELVDFQTRNKYLLMAFQPARHKELGRLVAGHNKNNIGEVFTEYEKLLQQTLAKQPKVNSIINALQHCFGGVSQNLSPEERKFFLNTLEEYRDERIPLATVVYLLKSWAVRFNNAFLLNQTLIEPYPQELASLSDTGKGRKF